MKSIKVINITAIIAVLVFLSSCSYFEKDNRYFGDGVLLDSEKMSEIKAEIFSSETIQTELTEISEQENTESEALSSEKDEQTAQEITNIKEDSETQAQSEMNTESETDSEAEIESATSSATNDNLVYWLESGKVWHIKRECSYIVKKENVSSGTLEDAIEAGKEKVCSRCDK